MAWQFFSKGLTILGLAVILSAPSARAQSGPPASQGQEQQQPPPDKPAEPNPSGPPQQSPDSSTDSNAKSPLPLPPELEVRPIGSSAPMPTYDTLLRWGPLYVQEVELLQSYDRISNTTGTNIGIFNQGSFNSTILRATIVYDKPVRQNRITIQYSPRLTVINGQVNGDFLNQTVRFDWIQQLSPRWTLGISNSVGYFSVRNLYGDYFLDVNAVTGTSVPTSILNAGGSWLNVDTTANFAYALSPTSSLSVAPFFGYGRVTGQVNALSANAEYQYGGQVVWNKQLSPFRSIRADYSYRVVGDLGNGVPYNNGDLGISQQLGPSTVLGVTVGVLSEGFLTGTQWAFSGSVQASRKVGRSTISIGYYRGLPLFSELNSQGVAQRADANFRLNMSERWYWTVEGGYEDSLSSRVIGVSGKYVSTELGYSLTPQVSLLVSYAHLIQAGTYPSLLVGTRDYALGGIRWTARPAK